AGATPRVLESARLPTPFFSASKSAAATIHGGTRPSASWSRSISRMGPLLSPPVRRYRAAVPAAVKDKALTGARSRASLTAAQHGGRQPMRPGRKDGFSGAKQKD